MSDGFERIHFPFVLPDSKWRRTAKVGLGRALLLAQPHRRAKVIATSDPGDLDLADRLAAAAIASDASAGDWSDLSDVHQRFWAGRGGHDFNASDVAAERFDSLFLTEHTRPFDRLVTELQQTDATPQALIEIGSGNGLVLEYLSKRFPQIPSFVGVDISAEATASNAVKWSGNSRLQFEAGDGVDWIRKNAGPASIYVVNGGVLEYFTQEKVEELYALTADIGGPAWWVVVEPIYPGYDPATETASRMNGGEFSFCHNHESLLEKAGWTILDSGRAFGNGVHWAMIVARLDEASRQA